MELVWVSAVLAAEAFTAKASTRAREAKTRVSLKEFMNILLYLGLLKARPLR